MHSLMEWFVAGVKGCATIDDKAALMAAVVAAKVGDHLRPGRLLDPGGPGRIGRRHPSGAQLPAHAHGRRPVAQGHQVAL